MTGGQVGGGGSEAGREGSEPDGASTFQWPPPSQPQPGAGQSGPGVSSYGPPVPSPAPQPSSDAGQPSASVPPSTSGQPSSDPDRPFGAPPPGDPTSRMRFQEPGVTQPRPPTVGEARARDKAAARRQEADLAEAEAARKRSRRKKILIGSGAVVGVVGLVAIAYAVVAPDDDVTTAQCVTGDGVVVEDRYCDGSPNSSGIFLVGGSSYRYNYGGYGSLGQRVSGGSSVYPRGVDVRTPTGAAVTSTGSKSTGSSGSGGSGSSGSGSGGSSAGSGSSGGSDSGSGTVSRGGLGSSSSGSSSGS